jgi:hypothetical protein
MKKLFFIAVLLMFCGKAWALPDNVISQEYNSDTEIKSAGGYVYNAVITFKGGAAGDEAWLWDATTYQTLSQGQTVGTNIGSARCHIVSNGANFTGVCGPYTTTNLFTTAIYFGYRSSGTVTADIQWQ